MLLPAGVIDRVDADEQTVYLHRTKEEIKAGPEFDPVRERDASYPDVYGDYYRGFPIL